MTDKGEDVVGQNDVLHTSSPERFLFSQFRQFPVNSNSTSVTPSCLSKLLTRSEYWPRCSVADPVAG